MLYSHLLKVVLITIIIVSMIFGSFIVNVEKADAIAVIPAAAVSIIAALLIGSGVIFNNDADITSVASDFYNSLDSENSLWVDIQAGEYSNIAYGQYTFQASKGILNALGNWLASRDWSFDDSGSGEFVFSDPSSMIFNGADFSWTSVYDYNYYKSLSKEEKISLITENMPPDGFTFTAIDKTFNNEICVDYQSSSYFHLIRDGVPWETNPNYGFILLFLPDMTSYGQSYGHVSGLIYGFCREVKGELYPILYNLYSYDTTTTFPVSSANVKSDTTYFPGEAVSSGVGTTEFPSNTASQPLTTDTPLTIPETGVNSTTGVTDVRAPGTTSPDIPATGFWDTLWQWLQSIVDGIAGIPAAIAAGVTGLIDFVKTLFDPSGFSLDFSPLKVGLTNVFPFCIPFDFLRAVQVFASDSSAFTFDIDLETEYFEIDHTVDLSPFALPIAFFRYVVVFWFGFILISRTRDFMKW